MSSAVSPKPNEMAPEQPPASVQISRERLVRLAICLALAATVLLVYSRCFHYPFLLYFDDSEYVELNQHVQTGLSAANFRWAFTNGVGGNWHPLTWLSLQLDSTLFGGSNAGAFHRTNVFLHVASTLLLFLILDRMTGMLGRSAFVAALLGLHPLNVESVVWISERKAVLSALFWMLTLAAYLGYVRRSSVSRYLLLLATFTLGLMCKPDMVTLPCALLLLDYWPLRRWRPAWASEGKMLPSVPLRRLLLEKLPMIPLVLACCIVTCLLQTHIKLMQTLDRYPLDIRILNALRSYVIYVVKTLWPTPLAAFYPHPGKSISVPAALACGLLLVVLTALVLTWGRRRPYLAVGWLWYLGTLVPMIGLIQVWNQALADRYAYIPTIGLFLLLTWGAADLAQRAQLGRFIPAVGAAVVLIFLVVLTHIQLGYWKDNVDLWQHALAVTTNNDFAHEHLGMVYYRKQQYFPAEKQLRAAAALRPDSAQYQHNLAKVLQIMGRPEEALRIGRQACQLASTVDTLDPHIHFLLAMLLRSLGEVKDALAEYRAAVDYFPDDAMYRSSLADLLRLLGHRAEARTEYQRAAELDPNAELPHIGLGNLFMDEGQRDRARDEFRRALELNGKSAAAHYNLALVLRSEGRWKEAENECRKAEELGFAQATSQVQACQRLRQLQPRLPRLLSGQDQPADNTERLGFAELCDQPFEARHTQSARLYKEAFSLDPSLTNDPRLGYRSAAAIASARAGCGQGRDAANLKDEEKAKLRRQSLEWLRADLDHWKQWSVQAAIRPALVNALCLWLRSDGLAGVREPAALARLPQEERENWRKLWQDIEALLEWKD